MDTHNKSVIMGICDFIKEVRAIDIINPSALKAIAEEISLHADGEMIESQLLSFTYEDEDIDENNFSDLELGLAGFLYHQSEDMDLSEFKTKAIKEERIYNWQQALRMAANRKSMQAALEEIPASEEPLVEVFHGGERIA